VAVQRCREPARRHRVLDEAEASVAVGAGDHEANADGLQRDGLAVARTEDGQLCSAAGRLRATLGLALDFLAWRTLYERGLSRPDAIAVMSSAVQAAASRPER